MFNKAPIKKYFSAKPSFIILNIPIYSFPCMFAFLENPPSTVLATLFGNVTKSPSTHQP